MLSPFAILAREIRLLQVLSPHMTLEKPKMPILTKLAWMLQDKVIPSGDLIDIMCDETN